MEFSLDLLVNKLSKWHFVFVSQGVQDIFTLAIWIFQSQVCEGAQYFSGKYAVKEYKTKEA